MKSETQTDTNVVFNLKHVICFSAKRWVQTTDVYLPSVAEFTANPLVTRYRSCQAFSLPAVFTHRPTVCILCIVEHVYGAQLELFYAVL